MKVIDVFSVVVELALSLGVIIVAIAMASALISHGWPQGDWALGWTSLAAIGGLVAGLGAFYASIVAMRIANQSEKAKALSLKVKGETHFMLLSASFSEWLARLNVSRKLYKINKLELKLEIHREEIKTVYQEMKLNIDLYLLHCLSPARRDEIAFILISLYEISNEFDERTFKRHINDGGQLWETMQLLQEVKTKSQALIERPSPPEPLA